MKPWHVLVIGLVLASNAAAQPATQQALYADYYGTSEGFSTTYWQGNIVDHTIGTFTQQVLSARYSTLETTQNATWLLHVTALKNYEHDSSGVWRWQVSIDGTAITGCYWELQTEAAGGLATDEMGEQDGGLKCAVQAPAYGLHNVTVTRSVISGSPAAILRSTTTIFIERQEFVLIPMEVDINTVIDQFIPFLFWFGFTAWLLTRNAILPAFGTSIVALGLFVPGLPWTATWGYLWLILTVWVHFIAGEKIYSRLFREARTE